MDPSDILRRIQSQTQFNYTLNVLSQSQKGANISTLQSQGLAKLNYISYAQREALALGKFYAEGGSTIGFGYIPNSGIQRLRLVEPSTFIQSFTYTGSLITFTLPTNSVLGAISTVNVYVWGAGGGNTGYGNGGGGGAFISGSLDVTGLTNLYIVVGGIGTANSNTGGGGAGNGGGFSGIFSRNSVALSNLLCCAGGGGGQGVYGTGGVGGLTSGGGASTGEGGGTQSAGGSGFVSGSLFLGGSRQNGDGGGGGGGYYGGGGANGSQSGGGGSSYTTLLTNFSGQAGNSGSGPNNPGGTTNQYYTSPYGRSSQNGYVVITATIFTERFIT